MARLETALTAGSIIQSVYGSAPIHVIDQVQGAIDDPTLDVDHYEGFNRVVKTLMLFKPDLHIAHATASMVYEAVGFHGDIDPKIHY